jgi:hypothetical protein
MEVKLVPFLTAAPDTASSAHDNLMGFENCKVIFREVFVLGVPSALRYESQTKSTTCRFAVKFKVLCAPPELSSYVTINFSD